MSRDKGQSLISIVLFTGIVLAGIGTVVTVAGPAIDNFQDAIAIDTAQDIISGIGSQVERVAEGGKGSQLNLSVSFDRGNLIFDSEDNEIEYRIDTETEIIAPHTSRRFGDLLMSATASVSVNRETVDGQDCWRIENEHIQTCIRAVDEPDDSIGSDTVGFWRFTNESGQTVVDNSSYGNSGTLGSSTVSETSDPSRVGGLRGKALEFDGNDDYVEIPDDESLDITEGLTVSGWFRFDETPAAVGEDIGIFSKNDITGSPTDIGPYGSIWRDG
ncbi:MAG: hypothetical protein MUP63_04520, partial [Candidatus Nanohaloarchaeota archaeon QJJ-7]|nr:hypothetical protein [Candidatus Nanohaloarchaeota archaeon QJJ-7]